MAKNFGKHFCVTGTGGSLAVVLGEFQRIRKQEGVEAGRCAGAAVSDRKTRKARFFRTQVKLREERRHFESGADDAFAEISDCFRNDANAAFVFGREEEGTKKWAVDAIAESELGLAEAFEKFGGKIRIFP